MITWHQLLVYGIVALALGAVLIFLGYFLDSRPRAGTATPARRASADRTDS